MGELANLVGFLRSLLFTIPLIYLYTFVLGLVSLVVAPFDRAARLQHGCARLWSRLILWTCFVRVRVRGLDNLKPDTHYVYIANHQSYMDIPVLLASLPEAFCVMAKASLFAIPFLGWHLRRTGSLPIVRDNPYAAGRRLREAVEVIRRGKSLLVFPEGSRSRNGNIGEFKTGVFLAAIRAHVPLVPITIHGSREVLPPYSWHIRPGTIALHVAAPIATDDLQKGQAEELAARVRNLISETLAARRQFIG